jgi:hypothetical protein
MLPSLRVSQSFRATPVSKEFDARRGRNQSQTPTGVLTLPVRDERLEAVERTYGEQCPSSVTFRGQKIILSVSNLGGLTTARVVEQTQPALSIGQTAPSCSARVFRGRRLRSMLAITQSCVRRDGAPR